MVHLKIYPKPSSGDHLMDHHTLTSTRNGSETARRGLNYRTNLHVSCNRSEFDSNVWAKTLGGPALVHCIHDLQITVDHLG